jgi:hypothetical protein
MINILFLLYHDDVKKICCIVRTLQLLNIITSKFLNPLFKHLSTKYLYRTGDVKYICIYFSKLRVYYITGNVIKLSVTSDRSVIFTRYSGFLHQ